MNRFFIQIGTMCIAFAALLICSCYQYEEEIWINKDHSGVLQATYLAPLWVNIDSSKSLEIQRKIDSLPGIKLTKWTDQFTDTCRIISFSITFQNIDSLKLFVDPNALVNHFAEISLSNGKNHEMVFTRTIEGTPDVKTPFLFDNKPLSIHTLIHFPSKILKVKGDKKTFKYNEGQYGLEWGFSTGFPLIKKQSINVLLDSE